MPKRFATADPDIVQYGDGTFYIRVGDRERSLKTKDFALAQKKKRAALDKLDQTGERGGRLRCGDVWADYIAYRDPKASVASRRRRSISAKTYKEMKDLWRLHLEKFWGAVRFDKIDEEKWDEYVDQADVGDLANHRKVFTGFLKWAKLKRYIKYVPEFGIPQVERRERHVLRPHEIKALFKHAQGSLLLFISMYLFMGMRRSEIMTLHWSKVFLDEGYLVLHRSLVKTRRGRSLPINEFVSHLLRARLLEQEGKSDWVFPNALHPKRHADVSGLKTAWNTLMKRCGFEKSYITPHDLRATFEAYAHKATAFTDTQREKFAGAAIDAYVRFDASDVRGLEEVVKVEGLSLILEQHMNATGKRRGREVEESLH